MVLALSKAKIGLVGEKINFKAEASSVVGGASSELKAPACLIG